MTYPYFKNQDRRALEGEILRVNHVKIIILAREKRAHQTKIYSVHFHGVRPFSCFTPIANHTLLGTKLDVSGLYLNTFWDEQSIMPINLFNLFDSFWTAFAHHA